MENLNRLYRVDQALQTVDYEWRGLQRIDFNDTENSVIAYLQKREDCSNPIFCVGHFTSGPRFHYRSTSRQQRAIANGSIAMLNCTETSSLNHGELGRRMLRSRPFHGFPYSLSMTGVRSFPSSCSNHSQNSRLRYLALGAALISSILTSKYKVFPAKG